MEVMQKNLYIDVEFIYSFKKNHKNGFHVFEI